MIKVVIMVCLAGLVAHKRVAPKPIKPGHALWPVIVAAKASKARIETCLAGVYATPEDKSSRFKKTAMGKDPTSTPGIAHRSLPLGSRVTVCSHRTGICVDTLVIDRGPYGKLTPEGIWFNGAREPERVGEWRGCADISAPLAGMLGVSELFAATLISEHGKRKRREKR